jgi:hypothetical protein
MGLHYKPRHTPWPAGDRIATVSDSVRALFAEQAFDERRREFDAVADRSSRREWTVRRTPEAEVLAHTLGVFPSMPTKPIKSQFTAKCRCAESRGLLYRLTGGEYTCRAIHLGAKPRYDCGGVRVAQP